MEVLVMDAPEPRRPRDGLPVPRPSEARALLNQLGMSRPLGELVRLHMAAGSGGPSDGKPKWSQECLAAEFGDPTSTHELRKIIRNGRPKRDFEFEQLLTSFDLRRPEVLHQREEIERAWELAIAETSVATVQTKSSPAETTDIRANEWFAQLPADINQRRDRVREAIAAVFADGCNKTHTGPLDALKTRWAGRALDGGAKPNAEQLEVIELIGGLCYAITTCNGMTPSWGDRSTIDEFVQRRRKDCELIAKLLFSLAWSQQIWPDLPTMLGKVGVQQAWNPRLLQAGIEMAGGRAFELPQKEFGPPPTLAPDTHKAIGKFADTDPWHLATHRAIQNGIGLDDRYAMLCRLWIWFNDDDAPPEPRQSDESSEAFEARLTSAELEDLAPIIVGKSASAGGRVLVFSTEVNDEEDLGLQQLREHAQRLIERAVVTTALGYERKVSSHLRGNEKSIQQVILDCMAAIKAIGHPA